MQDNTLNFAVISVDQLGNATGGYRDPSPSSSDTGIAGLGPAPCTPPSNPRPVPSPVWIPI